MWMQMQVLRKSPSESPETSNITQRLLHVDCDHAITNSPLET